MVYETKQFSVGDNNEAVSLNGFKKKMASTVSHNTAAFNLH